MCFKHIAILSAFCLAADAATAETLRGMSPLAQAETESVRAAPPQIQNVQRLLKLLADRYPKKYGSVDPGRVDGSFGTETKDAIRNFQKISGSKASAQNGDQLVADILAALAQISATQAADPAAEPAPKAVSPAPAVPAPQIAAVPPTQTPKVEVPKVEAPKTETPKTEPAKPEAPGAAAGKPAAPAAEETSASAEAPKAAKPKASRAQNPAKGQRVYFVQAASLKSLESAKREWQRIFDENRAALTGEQVYFEKANVGDRGLFFRILIGPMSERDAAKTLCAFLQQNDQTCVVTSRDPADLQRTAGQAAPAKPAPEASRAADKAGAGAAAAPAPAPQPPAAAAVEATAREAGPETAAPAPNGTVSGQDAAPAPAPSAGDPGQSAPQDTATAGPAAPAVGDPAGEPKGPGGPDGSAPGAGPDTADATNTGNGAAADPAPAGAGTQAIPPAPAATASAPPTEAATPASQPEPQTAPAGGGADVRPNAAVGAARAIVTQLSQQPEKAAGVAAALLLATGVAVYGWRRRSRRQSLSQIFQSANLPSALAPSESAGPMDDIETDYGSDSLRESRLARDAFLRDTLGAETGEETAVRNDDSAMRINSSLKALLVKEPAQYKSIFLNWIFLAKVGAALNNKEISFEQLSEHISREFDLLQTYFKIHLLELDDRHRIRQELPGLFYCLQLTQMKKRQNSAKFSAA